MLELDDVARTVLEHRYLRRDASGDVVETPDELFRRVADDLARAEAAHGRDAGDAADRFEDAMTSLDFLPNSPTLMNAGTELQQLAACFVLPVEDSLADIFETLKHTALIHQSGGGTGFSFSHLRPRGDVVKKTGGVASGPVSFMRVFDAATEQIKQGGRRRGANMGVLDASHPDVEEFVDAKRESGPGDADRPGTSEARDADGPEAEGAAGDGGPADAGRGAGGLYGGLRNFNLSVATDGEFWDARDAGEPYDLVNPRTGAAVGAVAPDALLDRITEAAWATGDPGLLFLDRIEEDNPTPSLGRIEATNPCGEVPLLPHEACVLGSVNLGHMTDGDEIDEEKLAATVRTGVRMLDDAITRSDFPLPAIEAMMAGNRRVGLGVMGFHDVLVDLGVPYHSEAAVDVARDVMSLVSDVAWDASRRLAEERGTFPNWEDSIHDEPVRNATVTSIAPTGTISMIAGCSASVEPIYNVSYTKQVMGGLDIVNDRFVAMAQDRGFHSEELMDDLHGRTSIQDVDAVPDDVKRLFHTAHDVPAEQHVRIQAAFQDHVDNAVSKTVNLPRDADPERVKEIFLLAREHDVKGITVFRSASKREQVLGGDPLKEECVGECEYVAPRQEDGRGSEGG